MWVWRYGILILNSIFLQLAPGNSYTIPHRYRRGIVTIDLFIIDTIDRDYKCVIYLGTVIKNRRVKESLALSKSGPKCTLKRRIWKKKACLHFSYKNILLKYSKNMKRSPKSWHRPFHPLRGYCTPDQFFDCLFIFLKNCNTLVTSKICFL